MTPSTMITVVMTVFVLVLVHGEINLDCRMDGYKIEGTKCVFKDDTSCEVSDYAAAQCVSFAERHVIETWQDKKLNAESLVELVQSYPLKPWVTTLRDLAPDSGMCEAYIPSFYFDGTGCKEFIYGGCQGNRNRFQREKECEQIAHLAKLLGQTHRDLL